MIISFCKVTKNEEIQKDKTQTFFRENKAYSAVCGATEFTVLNQIDKDDHSPPTELSAVLQEHYDHRMDSLLTGISA